MRILWFAGNPGLAAIKILKKEEVGGGWIPTIEEKIKSFDNIELGLAFPSPVISLEKHLDGKHLYYQIPRENNKLKKYINRLRYNVNNKNNLDHYIEIIKDFKPNIIHIWGTEMDFGLLISKVNIPVVVWMAGNLSVYIRKWFSGNLNQFEILRYSSIKNLFLFSGLFHEYYLTKRCALREQKIFSDCEYFIGRTEWDRKICRVLSPNSKYFFCGDMIRNEFYYSPEVKKNKHKEMILFSTILGNIYKGLDTVIEASIILRNNTNTNFHWKIAGINEDTEIAKIYKKKYSIKYEDIGIELLGVLKTSKLVEEMKNTSIYIHPSHIENSPNSVGEALLLGLPVIATYSGGTGNLIQNNITGVLIQDGDPYVLAGSIVELSENTKLRQELGSKARIKAREYYNPDTIIKDLLKIYETIIKNYN